MMKRSIALAVALAVLTLAVGAQQAITVRTPAEFVRALGSDRIITMAPGLYRLSDAYKVRNAMVEWRETYQGYELVVKEASNLTIRGEGVEIVTTTPYSRVLNFEGGSVIALEGLMMGHEAAGPCSAGVLSFYDVTSVAVSGCDLYGSGSTGIELYRCTDATVSDGIIRECTMSAAFVEGCMYVTFYGMDIRDNVDAWPLFGVYSSTGVSIIQSTIVRNSGEEFVSYGSDTDGFGFEFCTIEDNDIATLASSGQLPYFVECVYSGNGFDAGLDEVAEYMGVGYGGDEDPFLYWELYDAGLTFTYPNWLTVIEDTEERVVMSEPEFGGWIVAAKAYDLASGEDPDTQAVAIFNKVRLRAERVLLDLGFRVRTRTGDTYYNTEAPPYFAEYWAQGDGPTGSLAFRIRLVESMRQVWVFAALAESTDELEVETDLGWFIESVEYINY